MNSVQHSTVKRIVSTIHDLEIAPISDLEERRELILILKKFGTQYPFDLL